MKKIVMGTSLAPLNYDRQFEAVQSWIENGFKVISFNTKEEIDELYPIFSNIGVEFFVIKNDASKVCQKKLPYLQDILDEIARRTKHICGYFNSDIVIGKMSSEIYEYILEEADNSLVFAHRNEINEIDDIERLDWEIHFDGIDVFFIDRELVPGFYDDGFFVQSIWDLFVIEKCLINKIHVKELLTPLFFHKKHAIKWNFETSILLTKQFMKKYYNIEKNVYKEALNNYYSHLYNNCEKICFCKNEKYKCLFIVNPNEIETIQSVEKQDYPGISFSDTDKNAEEYDFLFYVNNRLVLEKIYTKYIIDIMERYDLDEVEVGRFFVTEIEKRLLYNELNRNMSILIRVNEESNGRTLVTRQGDLTRCKKNIYAPISYEKIEIDNREVVERIKLPSKAYLMPAGVRANEWYEINHEKIEVVGFLDNSVQVIGKKFYNKLVYSFEQIENESVTVIIASKRYSNEIREQLLNTLNEGQIIDSGYLLYIDESTGAYVFNLNKYKNYIHKDI